MTSTVEFAFTEEGLHAAMAACGSTSAEVAETFHLLSLAGPRGECHTCPGAEFLRLVYPDAEEIWVGEGERDTVRVDRTVWRTDADGYSEPITDRVSAVMPAPWDDFIEDYDDLKAQRYSFLEA